ncbi:MAG: tyrosinase family protein [Pseudomonadota bacterium]
MDIERRAMLAGLVAAASGGGLAAAATPRTRRAIADLSRNDDDLDAYRRAIPVMRRTGAWQAQVALHADMRHRHHSSWRFLPWHRLQLAWFEKQVARASGKADFALPYWDWDDDRIPDLFLQGDALDHPGREAAPGESIQDFLSRNGQRFTGRLGDDWATFFGRPRATADPTDGQLGRRYFSGSGEWSGHNLIHGFVGGDMGRLDRSPNDPLFWLHHANIDRIWALWQDRHRGEAGPAAWRAEALGGFLDEAGRPVPSMTAGATVDTLTFGYRYAFDPTPPIAFAVGPQPPTRRRRYSWRLQPMGPASGFIEISAALAAGRALSADGFLTATPDPHAASMVRLTARSLADGSDRHADAVFLVPMGHRAERQNCRIDLRALWSGEGPVRLEIEAVPLAGRRGGAATRLDDFVLDADLEFPT